MSRSVPALVLGRGFDLAKECRAHRLCLAEQLPLGKLDAAVEKAQTIAGKDYVKSASGLPMYEVRHLTSPHHWREAAPGESETDFSGRLAWELEQTIRNTGPDHIAGFFAERASGAAAARSTASTAAGGTLRDIGRL